MKKAARIGLSALGGVCCAGIPILGAVACCGGLSLAAIAAALGAAAWVGGGAVLLAALLLSIAWLVLRIRRAARRRSLTADAGGKAPG